MRIAESILLLLRNPRQFLASRLQHSPFFLQSQMDINPTSRWHNPEFIALTNGFFPTGADPEATTRHIRDLEPWDNVRRDMLILLLRTIETSGIEGELAEVGVYKGLTAKLIHDYSPARSLHLFDTFEGFTSRGTESELRSTQTPVAPSQFSDTSLESVVVYIAPQNDNVVIHPGYFPDSIPDGFDQRKFAFVHLDADLYEPVLEGLHFFYPRMSDKGIIVVHDYNAWQGARRAVDEFVRDKTELAIPMPDKTGSVVIAKQGH